MVPALPLRGDIWGSILSCRQYKVSLSRSHGEHSGRTGSPSSRTSTGQNFRGWMKERRIGNPSMTVLSFQWTDHSVTYDSIGGVKVQYRVRVGDSRGKLSNWSASCVVRTTAQPSAVSPRGKGVEQFRLQSNFPNPFNPRNSDQWTVDRGQSGQGWSCTIGSLRSIGPRNRCPG